MLSYKQWKTLNESIMPSFNLGIARPTNLGIQSPFATELDEAAKKAKKKMVGDEDEEGDGEMVPAAAEKDEPEVDVDVAADVPEEGDDCMKCKSMSKKTSKKKMCSDEEAPEEEAPEGEEETGEEPVAAPAFSKKKSKKKMCSDAETPEEEVPAEDGEAEEDLEGKELAFAKKKSKKKMQAEGTEEDQWWASIRNMTGPALNTKYSDGCESLFTPIDTENLTQAVREEPEA